MRPDGAVDITARLDHGRAGREDVAEGQAAPTAPVRPISGAHVVWVLLLASTVPWRKGVYFDGGLDSVVVGKAALSIAALVLAAVLARRSMANLRVPALPILLLGAYLAVTVVGGYASDQLAPAAVLAVRVSILIVTIIFLFTRYAPYAVARSFIHVVAVVTIVATVTGVPTLASGRLAGSLPPLDPNELALMASLCLVWTFAKMLRGTESALDLMMVIASAGVVLLTQSRASLGALCFAVLLMALRTTALSRRSFALTALLAPGIAYVAFGTDVLSSVFLRGGTQGLTTLSNRTIAWDAALTTDRDPWQTWFGEGLSQKKISVPGQWWNTQLLDSSWVSALVQGGLIGLALVLLLVLVTLVQAAFSPRRTGAVWLGVLALLVGRAFLESGLFDSTTSFAALLVAVFGSYIAAGSSGSVATDPSVAQVTDGRSLELSH